MSRKRKQPDAIVSPEPGAQPGAAARRAAPPEADRKAPDEASSESHGRGSEAPLA